MTLEILTAAKILEIAFGGAIEGAAGKMTELAIEKIRLLRRKIKNRCKGNPDAERALAAAEQGSQSDLAKVAQYLQAFMQQDPAFAREVQTLAKEINISNIEDNRSIHQTSDRSNHTIEVRADTTGDIISDIKADSIGRIGGRDTYY